MKLASTIMRFVGSDGLAANVFGELQDVAQDAVDRGIVAEELAHVRVEPNEPASLHEPGEMFPAYCPRTSEVRFRDIAKIDRDIVTDRGRLCSNRLDLRGFNHDKLSLRAWSRGAPR
jgi:hypothetical protein